MPAASGAFSSVSIFQLGGDPALTPLLGEAAVIAFGSPAISAVQQIEDAHPAPGAPAVLLLCAPTPAVLQEALGALDEERLPRWSVVVFALTPSGIPAGDGFDVVPRAEWQAPLIARVLGSAARLHALRRENARLRDDFATYGQRIAHDLRTPLGGVLTSTEMLREVLGEDSPNHVAFTAPIMDSAEGLVKIVDRISFLARANAQRDAGELLDLGSIFWNAFQRLESQVFKAGAALTQAQNWPKAIGHPIALEMVWRHLISNALEHGGAAVRIEAGWDPVPAGNRFWLTSSGPVAPEKRGTLFFPFNRLHEPGAPRGLGLPMVRRLVELDGGTCGFEETSTGGARFFFILPMVGANS